MKNTVSAIITAGGNGTRFGRDKMLVVLGGRPLIVHTLAKFEQSGKIDEIITLVKEKDLGQYQEIVKKYGFKKIKLLPAGSKRIISVYEGAKAAIGDYIITHDGNRPLTPVNLIDRLIEDVIKYKAAMTAVPPTATVKYSTDSFIEQSLPRSKTWIAQTPQGFERRLLLDAFEQAIINKHFVPTDDSELITRLGIKVKIVLGDDINMKITYYHDLLIAKQLLKFQYDLCLKQESVRIPIVLQKRA